MRKDSGNKDNIVAKKRNEYTIFGRGKTLFIMYTVFTVITILTMIAEIIQYAFIKASNLETTSTRIMLCILCLAVLNIPLFLEKRHRLHIPTNIVIITFIMVFGHFILGEIYEYYTHIELYDKILHTLCGVIFGLVSFSIITLLNDGPSKVHFSPFFVVIFTFCCAMTAEYLWEIFEYFMDKIFGMNMQRWQNSLVGEIASGTGNSTTGEFIHSTAAGNGIIDTMTDMIVNIFGALGVCIYAYIGLKLKPDWFVGRVIVSLEEMEESHKNNEESDEVSDNISDKKSGEVPDNVSGEESEIIYEDKG